MVFCFISSLFFAITWQCVILLEQKSLWGLNILDISSWFRVRYIVHCGSWTWRQTPSVIQSNVTFAWGCDKICCLIWQWRAAYFAQMSLHLKQLPHYGDVIIGTMGSHITCPTIVYSTVYSGADQRKHQSSASLAFVRGIHRRPVNSLHKCPVTRKMLPFDDIIMGYWRLTWIPCEVTVKVAQFWWRIYLHVCVSVFLFLCMLPNFRILMNLKINTHLKKLSCDHFIKFQKRHMYTDFDISNVKD